MDFPRALAVLFLSALVYLLSQCYLFVRVRRYLRDRINSRSRRRLFLAAASSFFFLMLFPFAWRLFYGYRGQEASPWLIRIIFGVFAVWGFGSTGCALVLAGYGLCRRARLFFSSRPAAPPDLGRRDFLKKSVGVAAAAPFLVSGYGVLLGRHRFEIEYFDLPVDGLSSALSQLSIVQLTDIHVGPFMPEEELRAYVEAVNRLDPDIVALTGDFVSTSRDEVAPCVNALAGLKARYGVFACMGNHDVYAGVEKELTRQLTQNGVRVLRNDAAPLQIGDSAVNILGIDDLRWGRPNLSHALEKARENSGEVQILLSHRPEVFPEAARNGLGVVLSGHYHGGQIKLAPEPDSLSIASLLTPYAEGLFHLPRRRLEAAGQETRGSVLFVGRGIGITGLPIRINCPPQIAHLTLRKA